MSPLIRDVSAGRHAKAKHLAEALNVSVQALYDAVARKEIAAVRIGKSIRIPAYEAARLLGIDKGSDNQTLVAA